MDLVNMLKVENIILDADFSSKEELIDNMINVLSINGYLKNESAFKKDIWKRENEISTEVGYGVALPHAKSSSVKTPTIVLARSLKGLVYDTERCHLFFMIAANEDATEEHLQTLSRLSSLLMDEVFRANLILAASSEEIMDLFKQAEEIELKKDNSSSKAYEGKKIVGITGCPTGIAHTFMAAKSLQNQADKWGIEAKIQTNGSSGVSNKLSSQDIEEADGIIIASDIKTDMELFEGKKIITASTREAIHYPEKLIMNSIEDKGEVYGGKEERLKQDKEKTRMKQPKIYTHLMNGVSFMIPFVVAGGIFIAISFMFGINAADPDSPQYNQFAAFLGTIGGDAAFALIVPILAGYIAYSIADRPGLAPGMIGGMLASIGGSGFLGGMIAGIVAGYAVLWLKKVFKNLPEALQGLSPVLILPLLGTFITGLIMFYLVNAPLSWVNTSLQEWLSGLTGANAILLGALLAGMMAFDMGGPINKTASAFGLAMFASQVYEPSAALMVGGMVPPLGIALATTLFKNRFDTEERNAGKSAYILGAAFITEAAIPFAAKDPLRIIPANTIGAAVGGAICMGLGISLQAPHGGIFVIPIAASSPLLYILSVVIGAVITASIIGLLKKPLYINETNKSSVSSFKNSPVPESQVSALSYENAKK
ncbi:fructose-specific PTS transporter subunit EIIC [Sinobaca sp. H24]|uniref:PTS fructose transporter subunit IIABC n=1 Tax=Sinobaca sp. H24 TaxID=2923376 RepID=UPI0027E37893|nr:fructose-specific PTS transporter subunit EIIC [Sinobaca sp. H24]